MARKYYNPSIEPDDLPRAIILVASSDDGTIYELAKWADDSAACYILTPAQAAEARADKRGVIVNPEVEPIVTEMLDDWAAH